MGTEPDDGTDDSQCDTNLKDIHERALIGGQRAQAD
jgi:hypothetical protein